ncbi:class V lanthionine synthetase subunit LxmK [Streptomyces sp. NBC_00190]|uniref:class V lanthionine synthetase subunit LxmK n=1 Tax=unclassified Streptomyces TaxID=2593676 RepID=UPI002E27AD10|nr:class V lanthionine synthetase subunit LxmK [Streptomyces sp. NBC_00190]
MTSDHRYRTRVTDVDSVPAVANALAGLRLGTLDSTNLVAHNGRNENWAGRTTSGANVFVKRLEGPTADVSRRLNNILTFEELLATSSTAALKAPRYLGCSEEDAIVVFELLPGARTGAERADDDAFEEKDAFRVGEMIGALHGINPAPATTLDTSLPVLPPVSYLDALPLETHRNSSFAELELWRILQQDDALSAALRRLRDSEGQSADRRAIHGDLRLDQLLFVDDMPYLIDWEELRWGDPARDLGAYIGEWLYRALRKLPGTGTEDSPEPADSADSGRELVARGVRELLRRRPLIEQFCTGYRSTGRPFEASLRERSAGFAGWHLIDRVMAAAARRPSLTPLDRAALGTARTVLVDPAAVTKTLGLED